MIDTVVLDLDGTLVDSVYVHTSAWRSAFRDVGVDVPSARIHRAIGMGGDKLVAAGITSILSFAPVVLQVPPHVQVRKVDMATELQILAYHAQRAQESELDSETRARKAQ